MNHYTHLTTQDRETAMVMLSQGCSLRAIARRLGRSPSTISREMKRNCTANGIYSAARAEKRYHKRRKRCHREAILKDAEVAAYVTERIQELKWSPEQIASRARIEGYPKAFSYAAIYRAIHSHLLPVGLKKHMRILRHYKRKKEPDKRSEMQDIRSIAQRPPIVDERARIGDWEGDSILGMRTTGGIGISVERQTGYIIAFLLSGGTSQEFIDKAVSAFAMIPRKAKATLTVDRGKEFTLHRNFEEQAGMQVYFCDPQAPWQKGTVENANGLMRQFFPKKSSFASITPEALQHVVDLINHRPRKRLGWLSPHEAFARFLL